jgi:hypothetical protein
LRNKYQITDRISIARQGTKYDTKDCNLAQNKSAFLSTKIPPTENIQLRAFWTEHNILRVISKKPKRCSITIHQNPLNCK